MLLKYDTLATYHKNSVSVREDLRIMSLFFVSRVTEEGEFQLILLQPFVYLPCLLTTD